MMNNNCAISGMDTAFLMRMITAKFTVFAILTANGARLKKFFKSCFGGKFDNIFSILTNPCN